ncbi:MAG: hypothetical protein AB1489_22705, partial [Acidobacteriota bacterium]
MALFDKFRRIPASPPKAAESNPKYTSALRREVPPPPPAAPQPQFELDAYDDTLAIPSYPPEASSQLLVQDSDDIDNEFFF